MFRLLGEGVAQMSSSSFAIISGESAGKLLMVHGKLCWHSSQRQEADQPRPTVLLPAALSSLAAVPCDARTFICGVLGLQNYLQPKIRSPSSHALTSLLHCMFRQTEVLNKSNRL